MFSFRFRAVHPKDVRDCLPRQLFEVPYNQTGLIGGGQIGCNYQVQSFVLGIETDFDGAHISGAQTLNTNVPPTFVPGTFSASSTVNWLGTLRVRAGFTPVDRWLVYATGGLAYGAVNNQYSLAFPTATDFFTSGQTRTKTGWTLGAGVEWAIWNNWSVKAEYLYYDLGKSTDVATPGGRDVALVAAGTIAPLSNSFTNRGSIARLGLNYKLY